MRILTAVLRMRIDRTPPCERAWEAALGYPIPWRQLWARLTSPLLTPSDFKAQTRIYHRSLFLRSFNPDAPSPKCRCCGAADERFSHLHLCDAIYETFDFFVNYANAHRANIRPDAGLIMLGLVDRDRTLQGGLSALHVILWKFVLIAFTRVDTEGITYVPVNVWLQAVRRFMRNVRAKDAKEKHRQQRARNLGEQPPSTRSLDAELAPVAHWDEEARGLKLHPSTAELFSYLESELVTYGSDAHQ